MKKVCFLFIATLVALSSAHAQDQKKDISSKTIKADSIKKILNTQPLPTKISKPVHPNGGEKMLNPQPLPPKADKKGNERSIIIVSGLPEKKAQNQVNKKMLTPQPLPPKVSTSKIKN